jgi:transcriptional regulator with XRE-family HTH domain
MEHIATKILILLRHVTVCMMNGPQLKQLRTSLGLSLRDLAENQLAGQVTHTTLSRWEASTDPIPEWAMLKLLGTTEISLPLSELHQLLDIARQEHKNFQDILSLAITAYLQSRRNAALAPTPTEQEFSRLNEDPTPYLTQRQDRTQSTKPPKS